MQTTRATLKDVSQRSGYALRTVKKVISGKERVSEKTRIAVLQAADELNYQRNMLASTLSKGKNSRIAIVYTETAKTYFPEIEGGFRKCAEELRDFGLSIELHKVHNNGSESQVAVLKEIIRDDGIDGLIIQPISQSRLDPYIAQIVEGSKVVITFGADAPASQRMCYIGSDAYKSGRIGAQILANYIGKKGNVAVISGDSEHMQTFDRIRGFTDRMDEHYRDIQVTNLSVPLNPDLYYELVKTIATKGYYRGIFCTDANSYIAGEVVRDLGIKDIVVVGFDMSAIATDLMRQGFLQVIIEQNPYHIAYSALKKMFNYLYLGEVPEIQQQYTPLSIITSECL